MRLTAAQAGDQGVRGPRAVLEAAVTPRPNVHTLVGQVAEGRGSGSVDRHVRWSAERQAESTWPGGAARTSALCGFMSAFSDNGRKSASPSKTGFDPKQTLLANEERRRIAAQYEFGSNSEPLIAGRFEIEDWLG